MAITNPQAQYLDNQDTFNIDIDDLFNKFIAPLDALRSHYNALVPNAQNTITAAYQESRCHTFLRAIGFPVVAPSGAFYSPGFDPNLNTDITSQNTNMQTAEALKADNDFIQSQAARESVPNTYGPIWGFGGVNASAISVGSIFLRSFAQQFTPDLPPLSYDKAQIQTVSLRNDWIDLTFGASTPTFTALIPDISSVQNILLSTHIIKPFIVDPRIDSSVRPAANKICAPFLLDYSQTFIFGSQNSTPVGLKRPYIENVIATRFNLTNVTKINTHPYVDAIINQIKQGSDVLDQDLLSIVSNLNYTLYQSEYQTFNDFIKFIRALVELLHNSIVEVQEVLHSANFQPQPNTTSGIEAGSNGATIAQPTPGDPNNRQLENNIISLTQKQILDEVSYNVGIGTTPDPGGFAIPNITDATPSANQNTTKSWEAQLTKLTNYRNKAGNDALDALKNIEIIMGEFSGIGLLDYFAIQAALWIMDPSALLGLIDTRAFKRLKMRQDINIGSTTQMAPLAALASFETTVQTIYKLIDGLITTLNQNDYFTDTDPVNTTNTNATSS